MYTDEVFTGVQDTCMHLAHNVTFLKFDCLSQTMKQLSIIDNDNAADLKLLTCLENDLQVFLI